MKRILLHLAISVLTFGLGVTVSSFWRVYSSDQPATADIPSPMVSIEQVTLGCGSSISYFYGLSNGGHITVSCQNFSSAAAANEALQARSRSTYDIIRRSDVTDEDGQPVGQTVLIVGSPTAVRLSTARGTLCETRASSLNDLLWFDDYENRGFR